MSSNPSHTIQRQPRYSLPVLQLNQQSMSMSGQYISPAQVAIRNQVNEIVSRLPPEMQQIAQQQISSEPNIEIKKQIAENYLRSNQMRMAPIYNSQGPQSIMVNASANQKVGLTSGSIGSGSIARVGVQQSVSMGQAVFPNQNSPMQTNLSTASQPQVSMQRSSNHGFITGGLQQSQNFTIQEATTSSSVMPNYNSSLASNIQQPSSVRPAIQQNLGLQQRGPNSVPSVIYAQSHPQGSVESSVPSQPPPNQEEERVSAADKALYEKKLADLKVHHDQIKRLKERQT
ncbi:unnamed protein product [Enterobius vermicularis]|uniref:QLQ domain-containing protein n=1 Tax=Enterobius vermicularis TaxID=51028 RepID=A0A0N4UVD6_ENTVE|nr:unnamed protein product [Enterobius vermicularis]